MHYIITNTSRFILFVKEPAMSFKIEQQYFEDNVEDQNGFTLNNGFYEKTLTDSQLDLIFDANGESKLILHSLNELSYKQTPFVFFLRIFPFKFIF